MKSILVIGLGKFGHHLVNKLVDLGNEVMIVDNEEEVMEDLLGKVSSAKIGDCTNENVLRTLGIGNFDICFVCIGSNFQSSLEITSLLKELGAKYVISKANRDIHAKFLLKNGADEVVYPDRNIAEKIAVRCSANHVFEYIELDENHSIYEIQPLSKWIGKSIKDVNCRQEYRVNILGIRNGNETDLLPKADYVFNNQEHLIIIGEKNDVNKLLEQL